MRTLPCYQCTVFSLIRTQGSYFFSTPRPCVTNGDCAIIGDWAIIISGRQFDVFCNISAYQMLWNVRCSHHTLGICRHMNSCHAPCTHCNMCTSFYTGASMCRRNLIEACASIGDWAFIFSLLETVLLLET